MAETKLRRETDSKMEQIRRQVEQDCGQFTTDINMKYEQILSEQLRQLDGELEKLRKGCMQVEERVI